jgi:hypothetical protein
MKQTSLRIVSWILAGLMLFGIIVAIIGVTFS